MEERTNCTVQCILYFYCTGRSNGLKINYYIATAMWKVHKIGLAVHKNSISTNRLYCMCSYFYTATGTGITFFYFKTDRFV
jgi:hypothetical protein